VVLTLDPADVPRRIKEACGEATMVPRRLDALLDELVRANGAVPLGTLMQGLAARGICADEALTLVASLVGPWRRRSTRTARARTGQGRAPVTDAASALAMLQALVPQMQDKAAPVLRRLQVISSRQQDGCRSAGRAAGPCRKPRARPPVPPAARWR
jgi:hypothetical protein